MLCVEFETDHALAPQGSPINRAGDVLSGAVHGAVGAMAMTGIRVMTTELGLVEQTTSKPSAPSGREHTGSAAPHC